MADNKINMSLDDIIKKERNGGKRGGKGVISTRGNRNVNVFRRKQQRREVAPIRRNNIRRKSNNNKQSNSVNVAAAIKVVNRLVKNAIQRRANQSLINRAARRSAVTIRPAGRGFRGRRRAQIMANRLSGVNQRSKIIKSGAVKRRARLQPMILSSPKIVRGRGASRMSQLISDRSAIAAEREYAPYVQQQMMQTVPFTRPRRKVIVQNSTRPILMRQQPIFNRRNAIFRKQMVVREQPVVVVQSPPRRQQRFQTRPIEQRIQRVVNLQQRSKFVRRQRNQFVQFNPNAEQLKRALGIGAQRIEPQRFESSSDFLQRVPINRKGRGFRGVIYQ